MPRRNKTKKVKKQTERTSQDKGSKSDKKYPAKKRGRS